MSKLICDVCGTTYPETATQCPICGSAKTSPDQTSAGEGADVDTREYAYVKGGRFSKKNVGKRNTTTRSSAKSAKRRSENTRPEPEEPNNTGLIVVVILLMLAIVAVLIYIVARYWGNQELPDNPTEPQGTVQSNPSTGPDLVEIPCEDMELSNTILELGLGESWTLKVQLSPVDTTDEVIYESANPAVATVNDRGEVTIIGPGETLITVTCGDVVKTCTIKSTAPEQTDPTDPPKPTDPIVGTFDFEFNTPYVDETTGFGDCTLTAQGQTWRAYKNSLEVNPADITWNVDDPTICKVEKGIVTALNPGKTTIHATYNGITYSCVIRCRFKVSDTPMTCTISHTDVTIAIGESFKLVLRDNTGNVVNAQWVASGDGVAIDGNKITGVSAGNYKVTFTYEGVTYTCLVRVKAG